MLLNLAVFQKMTGLELERKGSALCTYIFNKKKKEGHRRNTGQDLRLRVMLQFQPLILLDAPLPNAQCFLLRTSLSFGFLLTQTQGALLLLKQNPYSSTFQGNFTVDFSIIIIYFYLRLSNIISLNFRSF